MAIFAFFGITVPAFQIAGGVIFAAISVRTLQITAVIGIQFVINGVTTVFVSILQGRQKLGFRFQVSGFRKGACSFELAP